MGAPLGRHQLLQMDDELQQDQEEDEGEPLEPVPAEAAGVAADALLELLHAEKAAPDSKFPYQLLDVGREMADPARLQPTGGRAPLLPDDRAEEIQL